ncbi:hypothetical protein F5Y18DRAFT_434205 [Xylariaceae sp. FL1019]|nr:hypothetical protein F5Y18DRAFT_434205 [Xylariaceae sp. FL1019]
MFLAFEKIQKIVENHLEDGGRDGIVIGISSYDQLDNDMDNLDKPPLPPNVVEALDETLDETWITVKPEVANCWQCELASRYDAREALFGVNAR